jgi:hypothetical protein
MVRQLLACMFLLSAIAPAFAEDEQMTVVIRNSHPYEVQLEMYSEDRNVAWPGGGEVYVLDDSETKQITLACRSGESICYGAWLTGDGDTYWGVGPDNSHSCSDCCYVCDGSQTETINLVD